MRCPLRGSGWRVSSTCLILSKPWLLCRLLYRLLSILIGRLLTVRWLAILRLAVDIWLLLERRRTRHGTAPRHPTRTVLPTIIQSGSRLLELEEGLMRFDEFLAS
jgi:hypothetical protein